MNVIRRRPAKLVIQRYLPHRRLNQIGPAHNFGDALKVIIYHHRQVIGKQSVTAVNNKIFPRQALIRLNVTGEQVVKVEHGSALQQTYGGVFRAVIERAAMAVIDAPTLWMRARVQVQL